MKRTLIICFGPFLLFSWVALVAADAPPPNFVVINIDDLGYADIEPFGSKLNRTPNLNRMAAEGRRLTSFYGAPVCSPSRASLMTGCYPKRALPIPHVLFPAYDTGLAPAEITIAELLKLAGYATGIVGKWHLGDQPAFLPTRQGFQYWFGLPYSNDMGPAADGVKSNFGDPLPDGTKNRQPPLPLMRNEKVIQRVFATNQTEIVDLYTREAVRFIEEHKNKKKPFFLYLAHTAVHFPLYPGERFRGKSGNGLYGDWVEEMDWSVGEVLNALRANGLADKTLVLFTSDNGGTGRAVNRPLRGSKATTWEGGMRVPTIAWWPGKIPAGTSDDAICGMFDVLPTFAALAGTGIPRDRKIDGADIRSVLLGDSTAKPPHEVFYYFRGLKLEAVRDLEWKLVLPTAADKNKKQGGDKSETAIQLFNLKTDIGEKTDVAAQHPEVVTRLEKLVAAMKDDLGTDDLGPGCRAIGRVDNPQPLIGFDGKVRPGFELKARPASNP